MGVSAVISNQIKKKEDRQNQWKDASVGPQIGMNPIPLLGLPDLEY